MNLFMNQWVPGNSNFFFQELNKIPAFTYFRPLKKTPFFQLFQQLRISYKQGMRIITSVSAAPAKIERTARKRKQNYKNDRSISNLT